MYKYRLAKYSSKMSLTDKSMVCHLTFDVILIKWKISEKTVTVELSNYVTWSDFFNYWDEIIKNKSLIHKQALKTTIY